MPSPIENGDTACEYYHRDDMDAFHEKVKAKITQLHECLGEYESKEWCGHCIMDSKCAQITMYVNELKNGLKTVNTWFASNNTKTRVSMDAWKELRELLGGLDIQGEKVK